MGPNADGDLGIEVGVAKLPTRNAQPLVEEVDAVMKLGANHPMGPLALADMIGLDTILSVMEARALGCHKVGGCPVGSFCPMRVRVRGCALAEWFCP